MIQYLDQLTLRTTALSTTYNKALKQHYETNTKREVRLRASSLPTCSLLLVEQLLNPECDHEEAMMDYYCSVGTAIHTHLQKWLGKTGKIFGNWVCPYCGHTHLCSVRWHCPKCQGHMDYRELEVELDIFSGHIDGVLLQDNGRYIVYDFKSSSTKTIYAKKFIPVSKHLLQLSAYATILQQRGLDIESMSILYVARDCPTTIAEYNIELTPQLAESTSDFLDRQILGYQAAKYSVKHRNLNCACDHKMCKNWNDYKENMEKFFYDGCPLASYCFKTSQLNQYFETIL